RRHLARAGNSAEVRSALPARAVEGALPEVVVQAADEDVDPAARRENRLRIGGEHAAERLPAAPASLHVASVPQRVVATAHERGQSGGPVEPGTERVGADADRATQRFPGAPAARVPSVPQG